MFQADTLVSKLVIAECSSCGIPASSNSSSRKETPVESSTRVSQDVLMHLYHGTFVQETVLELEGASGRDKECVGMDPVL